MNYDVPLLNANCKMKLSCPFQTRLLKLCFITSIFSTLLALPSLCTGDQEFYSNRIDACLVDNGVRNFTLFPGTQEEKNGTAFYSFLDFSIQNLRFTLPSVPKPVAIVMPASREQLVRAVQCCRKGSLEMRVRSGGHSYEGSSSVATDGMPFVIIDLMNLEKISIDLASQTAWVEGGVTLGQLYYAIAEKSTELGFSAGSCPTVGVGGQISGGGYGLFSRKYGLAADNVLNAVLVDAGGQVLDRESMGEDVFWAIRGGGGGNWGIIYAWKIKLVQVPGTVTVFEVSRSGTKPQVANLVGKWQQISPQMEDDYFISVALRAGKTGMISSRFLGLYLGPKPEFIPKMNELFPELNVAPGDYKEMSWIEAVYAFTGLAPASNLSLLKDRHSTGKSFFKAKSDYVTAPISMAGLQTAFTMLEKEPRGYVIWDPYGGILDRISTDSIAFPHRKGNLFSIQYLVEWGEEEERDRRGDGYLKWIRGFYLSMRPYVSKAPRAAYVNYMDLDLGVMEQGRRKQNDVVEVARVWGEKYFLKNYDRLVKAKTIVDPLNVFRHQQGIFPNS